MVNLIDKYLILTLPRSIKRQWAVLYGTVAMGVPYESIRFVAGIDRKDYHNNMQSVAEAAVENGYPFLGQFGLGLKDAWIQQSAGNIALFWGWAKTLKHIAASGETTLLTWDDRIPRVPYRILEKITAELYQRQEDFFIFQLRLRSIAVQLQLLNRHEYTDADDIDAEKQFFDDVIHNTQNYSFPFLQKGLLGHDETMIMSPRGADWLLTQMFEMEDMTEHLKEFEFKNKDGVPFTAETADIQERSRINNDNWLHWGITEAVQTAEKDGIGLYSPKRMGYEFFHEPLDMGTDVFWDPNKHPIGKRDWTEIPPTQIQFMQI